MILYELMQQGTGRLEEAGIDNAAYDSKTLIKYVFGLDETALILGRDKEAEAVKAEEYLKLIEKRAGHYPLQYIMHSVGFMEYDFYVDEGVLIPRSDTEVLVEEVLKYLDKNSADKPVSLLDMCTGSGCIGISCFLSRKAKGVADSVTLADISEEALRVAGKNAEQLEAGVKLVKTDVYEALSGKDNGSDDVPAGQAATDINNRFDVIVSNPPYIRSDVIPTLMEEVKDFEPMLALDGDKDGMKFYRRIIGEAPKYLNPGGAIFLEIGYDQYEDTRKLLVEAGFTDIKLVKDLAGLDRVVSGKLAKEEVRKIEIDLLRFG
ncbi:MAG: peptide chain release factor N(5)-glutamine methyltransferase [Eubacterium sp.]|nr:peptide chain release factor N(5)-glutamine methyltransferase [Eubacterium sp.]